MRLLFKFFLAELAVACVVLLALHFNPFDWEAWGAPMCTGAELCRWAAQVGVGLALAAGLVALGFKARVMHSKSAKLVQRALLSVALSMVVRALALAGGLLWAVKMHAPGAFLLGFLCVYAMQLVLEVGYLVFEQKRQSLPQRENE